MTDSSPRTVRDLGEFGLIARMNRGRSQAPGVLLGPGDDAAVVAAPAGRFVVSADMLVQDRHFRLDWSSAHEIGAKAIAQNAADVVAMGARPTAYLVSLACPNDTAVEFVDGLTEGLWAEAGRSGGSIAGGDVVGSPLLVISVTAFGDPVERPPVLRSGARPGDIVAVAGRLGWSAAGLAILSAGIDPERFPEIVAAHRLPQPPYESVLSLPADAGVSAMTDVSDGLLADIGHIAESSGVAVDLDSAAVRDPDLEPVAGLLDADPLAWSLAGGEDHAFAATFAPAQDLPAGWTRVGRVEDGSGVTVDGRSWSGPLGWESFTGGG
ncbi:thiamine-phosphate kinase [Nocardia transvalensis]|uniref:thiamine-phosphate kinase n=1 Tax=Nocardia transvalensis TaxID=37333 RepID=UPI0018958F04|nr:thiamine-phosphate kinase [Nocardia transvalensis]MBF6329269.1 thiamine-phosphate kinase [Nocardia transvalensis]